MILFPTVRVSVLGSVPVLGSPKALKANAAPSDTEGDLPEEEASTSQPASPHTPRSAPTGTPNAVSHHYARQALPGPTAREYSWRVRGGGRSRVGF